MAEAPKMTAPIPVTGNDDAKHEASLEVLAEMRDKYLDYITDGEWSRIKTEIKAKDKEIKANGKEIAAAQKLKVKAVTELYACGVTVAEISRKLELDVAEVEKNLGL